MRPLLYVSFLLHASETPILLCIASVIYGVDSRPQLLHILLTARAGLGRGIKKKERDSLKIVAGCWLGG